MNTVFMSRDQWDDILKWSNANTTAGPTNYGTPLTVEYAANTTAGPTTGATTTTFHISTSNTAATPLPWENAKQRQRLSAKEKKHRKVKRKQAKTARRRNR